MTEINKIIRKVKEEQEKNLNKFKNDDIINKLYDGSLVNSFKSGYDQNISEESLPFKLMYDVRADILTLKFEFEQTKPANMYEKHNVLIYTNKFKQTVQAHIAGFSSFCTMKNPLKVKVNEETTLTLKYDKDQDMLEILFSDRKPTDYVESEEIYGVVKQYVGKEHNGYVITLFSKFYNFDAIVPKLEIKGIKR